MDATNANQEKSDTIQERNHQKMKDAAPATTTETETWHRWQLDVP